MATTSVASLRASAAGNHIRPLTDGTPGLKKLRARQTWPRIGYVEPRGENAGQMLIGMAIYTAVVLAVVGVGIITFIHFILTHPIRDLEEADHAE